MHQHINGDATFLFVDKLPETTVTPLVVRSGMQGIRYLFAEMPVDKPNVKEYLPDGHWQLLGLSNELSEERAKEIVPKPMVYKCSLVELDVYLDYTDQMDMGWDTAKESFASLLLSLNISGNCAVLKKI